MITLLEWQWFAAFLGCFLFGGIAATVLLHILFRGERRDTIRSPPPVHVHELWPRDDEPTRTKISGTC